jgi:5'-3' exoribonuclease 1
MLFTAYSRVAMVQDSGGVPLSAKGVVIGLNAKSIDVVWDIPFMSDVTMDDRCGFHPLYFDVIDM